ncbi:hypothetical protein LSAT2_032234 [Lamellibrachia satsuma]|nr:hypothetical protein LSAT2_032234 [Lamellibrachia satsuma]
MKTIILVWLVGLLAASLAEETAQTEQVNDDASKVGTEAVSYDDVMGREKRHLRDALCGICHPKKYLQVEFPCHSRKWVSYKKKSKCGWWRRRHTCYKTKHHFVISSSSAVLATEKVVTNVIRSSRRSNESTTLRGRPRHEVFQQPFARSHNVLSK